MDKPPLKSHPFFFSEAERLYLASNLLNFGVWEFEFANSRLIWDDKMFDIYGVDKANFSNKIADFRDKVHPEDLAETDAALSTVLASDKALFARFRIIRADGQIRNIEGNVKCIKNASGEPIRLIGINHDVTDQRLVENKLHEQNIQLRKIAWMQSHEIRKPVANIIGLINLCDATAMDDYHQKLISYLKSSVHELDEMIKRIIQKTKDSA